MQFIFKLNVDEVYGKFLESKGTLNYSKREANKTSKSTKSTFLSRVAERPDRWEDPDFFFFFKELITKGKGMFDLRIVHSEYCQAVFAGDIVS